MPNLTNAEAPLTAQELEEELALLHSNSVFPFAEEVNVIAVDDVASPPAWQRAMDAMYNTQMNVSLARVCKVCGVH